jgi:hypothetical protein
MASILRDIHVRKVDLVGRAANRQAICLFKAAATKEDSTVDKEELLKAVKDLSDEDRTQLGKDLGFEPPGEPDLVALVKDLDEEKMAEFMEAIKPPDPKDLEKDDGLTDEQKAAVAALKKEQEDLKKANEELTARVEKAETDRKREKFIKQAGDLKDLPEVAPDDFGEVLMKCSGALDEAEMEKLNKVLRGSAELVKQAAHFREIGRPGRGEGSAYAELCKRADERVAAAGGPQKLTKEAARTAILGEDDDLADRVRAEETSTKGGE